MFDFFKNLLLKPKLEVINHPTKKCKTGDFYMKRIINILKNIKDPCYSNRYRNHKSKKSLLSAVFEDSVNIDNGDFVYIDTSLNQIVIQKLTGRGVNTKRKWLKFPVSTSFIEEYKMLEKML